MPVPALATGLPVSRALKKEVGYNYVIYFLDENAVPRPKARSTALFASHITFSIYLSALSGRSRNPPRRQQWSPKCPTALP